MFKTAVTANISDLRYNFKKETTPFLGVVAEQKSQTRVEIDRDDSREEISFRSQGERLAFWFRNAGESPVLQIFTPSEDVDMFLFHDRVAEIYKSFPELLAYLKDAFDETPEELLGFAARPEDRAVITAVFNVTASV